MAKWSTVNYSLICSHSGRIDAEYYKAESLQAYDFVKGGNFKLLGQLTKEGYRVVYENTKILRSDKVDAQRDVRFLQATNVSEDGLWIELRDIGFVSEKDWKKYPKGRIKHGELLIEVKGQAEKVTIVQDYMPIRTLVTGTLYKLTVNEKIVSPEYIYAYFSCKYGKILRDRTKVNTLISYVSKPELYNIPIPIFENHIDEITNLVKESYRHSIHSRYLYKKAETILAHELQLDKLKLQNKKWYTANYCEIIGKLRSDAEFYNPQLVHFYQHFSHIKSIKLKSITDFAVVKKFSNPTYANKGIPIITQRHLSDISPENYGNYPLADESWGIKYKDAILRKEDLLFYSVGAYLGKTNIWMNEDEAVFASFITMLRCNDILDSCFLMLVLNSSFGILQSKVFQSGTSQPYIYPKDIKQFMIPDVNRDIKNKLFTLIHDSYYAKRQSKLLLAKAKQRMEELIEHEVNKNE